MPTLRSGLVIAGAYADKLRRTMFAQLKNDIREGRIKASDVAYHVAQLNKVLYRIFVEKLKVDKGDVVRINIDYELTDEGIKWDFTSLKIEVFKRVPQEEVDSVVSSVVGEAETIMERAVEYQAVKIGETEDGDNIFVLKLGDREVGAFEVVPIDNEFAYLKKGAALDPSPMIVEKVRIPLNGGSVEDVISRNIELLTKNARYVEREEAEELINYIKSRVQEVKTE
ncbi:MAG TPA: DUF2258 domain-containing protein [Thermoprotei archaeon]|nr:DUF2258 domain-containing protein [Thermoprotei archaeon]